MSSKSKLMRQQRQWAESIGLTPSSNGYLGTIEENLLQPLNEATKIAFDNGSGLELQDTPSYPAKMKALHSSSALAVNFFDHWIGKDTSALTTALELNSKIVTIKFEEQFPTGLPGNPPNLDIVLELANGHIIGIESKFSEWLSKKLGINLPFKPKYFPEGQELWTNKFLPKAQHLAEAISRGKEIFYYLDAPQLLKHALGMATKLDQEFSLFYIYFDWTSDESETHHQEINRFAALIDDSLKFQAMSYQQLFALLEKMNGTDKSYINYLHTRYFSS